MSPTLALLMFAAAIMIAAFLRWARGDGRSPARASSALRRRLIRPPSGSERPTIQSVCDAAAAELGAAVVVVKPGTSEYHAVAGAPWQVSFGPLDKIAISAAFENGRPAGKGSGRHGMTDWLFVPIAEENSAIALVGIAGQYCRRRFVSGRDPVIGAVTESVGSVLRAGEEKPILLNPAAAH